MLRFTSLSSSCRIMRSFQSTCSMQQMGIRVGPLQVSAGKTQLPKRRISPLSVSFERRASADSNKKGKKASKKFEDLSSTSFSRGIFRGLLKKDEVFPYPADVDSDSKEILGVMMDATRKYMEESNDAHLNDKNARVSEESLEELKAMGLFGMQVPEDYGGLGMNSTSYACMTEVVGAKDLGLGILLGAHQSIGFKAVLLHGTKEQKEAYLPKLATGEILAAFALTEPEAGSDAGSVKARAILSEDKTHYVLNGSKIWISNGGISDLFTVFAQVPVTDEVTGETKDKMTAFIVTRDMGGVNHGPEEHKMGIKASNTTEVYFEDTKVPVDHVIGEVGEGFKIAMSVLNNGRFGMSAALCGTMKGLIINAVEFAAQRKQFKTYIKDFGLIQEKIGHMVLRLYATESIGYMLSSNMDRGCPDYQIEAAISKVFSSENAWWVCDETIQTMGGMGVMEEAGVEKVMRDLRVFRIFEGTNDILRLMISLTGIGTLGKELQSRKFNSNMVAALVTHKLFGNVPRRIAAKPSFGNDLAPALAQSGKVVEDLICSFSSSCFALILKHQKKIMAPKNQFPLRLVADAAIDITAMAAVLSRASKAKLFNYPSADHEVLIANTFCSIAAERVNRNLFNLNDKPRPGIERQLAEISNATCDNLGFIPSHPVLFSPEEE